MNRSILTSNGSQITYQTPVRDIRDGYQPTKQQQPNNKPPHPPSGGSGVPKK
jgi:hypothetical protein